MSKSGIALAHSVGPVRMMWVSQKTPRRPQLVPCRPASHLPHGHSYFRCMRLDSAVPCLGHSYTQQILVSHHLPARQAPFRLSVIKQWSSLYGTDNPAGKIDDGGVSKAKNRAISKSTNNWECHTAGQRHWAVAGSCFRRASLGRGQ